MIGEYLDRMIKKRSYNYTQFCKISGLKNAHLSKLISNKSKPSIDILIQLADALHCSLDELVGRS